MSSPAVSLRRVSAAGVEPLLAIMEACGASMVSRLGLRHWDPPLSILELRAYASEREVWAIHSSPDGALVGGVITGPSSTAPYVSPAMFRAPDALALYISKLAIDPTLQGAGLGAAALAALEALARERGLAALRLDALRAVPNLPRLYARAGYTVVATASAADAHGVTHELDIWERVLREAPPRPAAAGAPLEPA